MNDQENQNRCPKCGGPIPAEASQGVCPKCLLAAVALPTEAGQPTEHRLPPPAVEAVQAALPHLEVLELIGCGGMGAVYRARQPKLDRMIALKVLIPPLAAEGAFAERFNREARLLARLNHPGVVSVYDYGEAGGFFYLVMEFVDGVNLRQAMQAGRFTPAQALALVPKICEALQYAHDEGILHRDIKPENILLDIRGRVKIADFGIAKMLGDKSRDMALTASGAAVGTPHYMAPEQLEHPQDVDQRADIYSLGVVFYEMLTGELPIGRFAPPSEKTPVDPRVDEVVLRALAKERERRQQNATEIKQQVETIASTFSTPAQTVQHGQPPASSAAATVVMATANERRATCHFSTPRRMENCFPAPAARIFMCKGELRLNAEQLVFVNPWQTEFRIPLDAIEDLSIGQFQMWTTPWVMKYERVNFLSVTFPDAGRTRTVHLTPVTGDSLQRTGRVTQVSEWFEHIQEAVKTRTGRTPHTSDPGDITFSAEPAWNRKGLPLFLGGALSLLGGIFTLSGESMVVLKPLLGIVGVFLWAAALWFSIGFLQANAALKRGDFDAVTSDEPIDEASLSRSSWPQLPVFYTVSAWLFILIGATAVIEFLTSLYQRPLSVNLNPGMAHLLAGIALLTLSRGWRRVALFALGLAGAADVIIGVMSVVWPEKMHVKLPWMSAPVYASENPQAAAVGSIILVAILLWPLWLLLSAKARALFGGTASE